MTFGLYTIPTSSFIFRKLDGAWTALNSFASGNPSETWKYYTTEKGKPVEAKNIESNEGLQCLTYCRSVAKVLYGVPTDVDLYSDDAKGIQKFDQAAYTAAYNKENYSRIELKISKDKKEAWTAKAKAEGMSLTAWIVRQVER